MTTDLVALTDIERTELLQLEDTIQQGMNTFVSVGTALLAIRDKKLYRSEFTSFADYVETRWEISRSRAYQLISAGIMSTQVDIQNEKQARELKRLPEPLQPLAWDIAQRMSAEIAPGKAVPSRIVKAAVNVVEGAESTGGYVDLGDGQMTALDAAVVQETFEIQKRQRQHIRDSIDAKFKQERLVDYLPFVIVKVNKPARRIVLEVEDSDSGKIALNAVDESMLNLRLSIVQRVPVEEPNEQTA